MKRKNNLLTVITAFLLTILLTVPALATETVSYWYSDKSSVGYTPYDGSYYIYNYSDNETFKSYFQTAVDRACSQWNNVLPIGVSETSFNYAVSYVYGGTYDQLVDIFPDLSSTNTGLTYPERSGDSVKIKYDGSNKTVYILEAASKMCVVQRSGRTLDGYKKTAIHEMGHLFGWLGHSSSSSDVMYASASEVTTLTTRDKRHLKQIYDLFY